MNDDQNVGHMRRQSLQAAGKQRPACHGAILLRDASPGTLAASGGNDESDDVRRLGHCKTVRMEARFCHWPAAASNLLVLQ
jgi:hypothetical protein